MSTRKQSILEVTVRLLEERGPDGFTIDDVLVESDTSASSLYHHFGSREGLLAEAQRYRYQTSWGDGDRRQVEVGQAVTSNQELLDFIAAELRRIATDPEMVAARRARVQTVAKSFDSRAVAESRAHIQQRVISEIDRIFATAQQRGFAPRELDTRAYSAFFFGLAMSRAFTEDGSLDVEAWLAVAVPAAQAPLRMDPSPRPASNADR